MFLFYIGFCGELNGYGKRKQASKSLFSLRCLLRLSGIAERCHGYFRGQCGHDPNGRRGRAGPTGPTGTRCARSRRVSRLAVSEVVDSYREDLQRTSDEVQRSSEFSGM